MKIRGLFRCDKIVAIGSGTLHEVTFSPCYDPSTPMRERLIAGTPWGQIVVPLDNPRAIELLKVGGYYYADLSPMLDPVEAADLAAA